MDKNKVIESAAKLIAKGQLEKAAKEFQRALDADPDDVRILQKLAELYQKMGRKDEAADCFEKVAKTYSAQGFYLKAVALYKQVLKVVERIQVNIRLAELYQQLGLIGDATKEWQNVASYYEKIGDLKASLDTLRKLVDLDPDNVAARIRLGEQYARQENFVEAVSELRRAAAYLQRNGRTDDYMRVAERISHLDQGDAALARELAENYLARGDSKRALAKLQICFKANPRDLQTLQMLARAFQELGQVTKTVSVLKELARVHLDGGRNDDARQVYLQAQQLAPDDLDIQNSLQQLDSPGGKKNPSGPGVGKRSSPGSSPGTKSSPGKGSAAKSSSPGKSSAGKPASVRATASGIQRPVSGKQPPAGSTASGKPRPLATDPAAAPARPPSTANRSSAGTVPPAPAAPQRSAPPPPPPLSSPGAGAAPIAATSTIPKLLKETEVYVKYGLHEKALDHLSRVFALEPDNTEAHEKAKTLALAMKRPEQAAESLAKLVRLYSARSDPRADAAKKELRELDPKNSALEVAPKLGSMYSEPDETDRTMLDARPIVLPPSDPAKLSPHGSPPGTIGSLGGLDAADISQENQIPIEPLRKRPESPAPAPVGSASSAGRAPAPAATRSSAGTAAPASAAASRQGVARAQPAAPAPAPAPVARPEPVDEALAVTDGSIDESAFVSSPGAEFASDPGEDTANLSGSDDTFASDLAEADFYIDAGLAEDARAILEGILLAAPDHAEALEKIRSLGDPVEGSDPESGEADWKEQSDQSDGDAMAAQLAAELASEMADLSLTDPGEDAPLSDIESTSSSTSSGKIQAAVPGSSAGKPAEAVRREDAQTHYDLGIAYKEMGLLDEAIAEFELALQFGGGVRKADCITALGVCAIEKGHPEEAVAVFRRALDEPDLGADAQRALTYELGLAYEAINERALALEQYKSVERSSRGFRDTVARIQRLGGTISGPRPKTGPIPTAPTATTPPPQSAPSATAATPAASAPPPPPSPTPAPPAAANGSQPGVARHGDSPASGAAAGVPATPAADQPEDGSPRRNRKIGFI